MISIEKDSKSDTYILTQTDNEGFLKQMHLTWQELVEIETFTNHVNFQKNLEDIRNRRRKKK